MRCFGDTDKCTQRFPEDASADRNSARVFLYFLYKHVDCISDKYFRIDMLPPEARIEISRNF